MKTKHTKNEITKINKSFDQMNKSVKQFLKTCAGNRSPVWSIVVRTSKSGMHLKTSVRYYDK